MTDASGELFTVTLHRPGDVGAGTTLVASLATTDGRPLERVETFATPHGGLEGPWELLAYDSAEHTAVYRLVPAESDPVS